VLSTGSELVDFSDPLVGGKIRDTNRPMLLATLRRSGFTPVDLGSVKDDASAIAGKLQQGVQECDAVISTGGVSVGDADFVKTVLLELCGEAARSMQVAIKPGKPFAFGVAGPRKTPVFGLAGNPVSNLVGFELLVRPALRLLAGHQTLERPTLNAVLDCPLPRRRDGKLHLIYVTARFHEDGRLHVRSAVRQGSHLLSGVANGNAIVMVADGDGLEVGEVVPTVILDSEQWPLGPASTAP
jgi:molybdenum cofactor synthesis domain-containing protein